MGNSPTIHEVPTDDDRPLLMQFKNKLYDIRGFAAKHPGGRKVLEKVAGSSIDKFMNGEERILGVKHEHSKAAFEILERYSLDQTFKVGIFLRGEARMTTSNQGLGTSHT